MEKHSGVMKELVIIRPYIRPFRFLDLPKDIRLLVYGMVYPESAKSAPPIQLSTATTAKPSKNLLLVCRQIYEEASQRQKKAYRAFWQEQHLNIDYVASSDAHQTDLATISKSIGDWVRITAWRGRFSGSQYLHDRIHERGEAFNVIDFLRAVQPSGGQFWSYNVGDKTERLTTTPDMSDEIELFAITYDGQAFYLLQGSDEFAFMPHPNVLLKPLSSEYEIYWRWGDLGFYMGTLERNPDAYEFVEAFAAAELRHLSPSVDLGLYESDSAYSARLKDMLGRMG